LLNVEDENALRVSNSRTIATAGKVHTRVSLLNPGKDEAAINRK
jgi:hypothetical protein